MIVEIVAGVAALIVAIGAMWGLHKRQVITAEQRGRLDEIARHNAISHSVKLARKAEADAILNESAKVTAEIEIQLTDAPVTEAEVVRWTLPPNRKPGKPS